uniref:Fibrinogen C-terminal domain-containing protein n=1 Tax=Anopheles farauti TaxID=69004 RepID=A0A9I3GJA5_9DIPT
MCFIVAKVSLYAFLVILILIAAPSRADNVANTSLTGYGYEILLAKLDYLQYKLIEMDYSMKEDREVVSEKQTQLETLSDGLLWAINQMSHNLTALQTQSMKILSLQKACASHEQMRREIQQLAPKDEKVGLSSFRLPGAYGAVLNHQTFRSCKEEISTQSGKYLIQPSENYEPFMVYCEQQRFGGGWLMIQVRFDGSENFYRNWSEYRKGFGSIDGEFWIGLEHLHQLTTSRPYELLVELEDFNGNYVYARYKEFEVGSETEHYQLKKVGAYSGTAGDSLTYHKGMKFSTMDRDNDENAANCAINYTGAWWYKNCHYANLNGPYKNNAEANAITWYHYTNKYMGMAYSRMMIREVQLLN